MTLYDHQAIWRAYKDTISIVDDVAGVFDKDGNKVTLDQSKIDAARAEIDAELAATKYQRDRQDEYPSWQDQLDYIYHNGIDKWKTDIIDPVKQKYPKSE